MQTYVMEVQTSCPSCAERGDGWFGVLRAAAGFPLASLRWIFKFSAESTVFYSGTMGMICNVYLASTIIHMLVAKLLRDFKRELGESTTFNLAMIAFAVTCFASIGGLVAVLRSPLLGVEIAASIFGFNMMVSFLVRKMLSLIPRSYGP